MWLTPPGKVLAGPSIRELADMIIEMMLGPAEGGEADGGGQKQAAG